MNEELKIVIKAVTDDINKKLDEVKKQLEGVGETAEKSGKETEKAADKASKGIGGAMKKVGAAVTVAMGAVVALVGSIVKLGQSSIEFQKSQAQLISGFQGVGASAQQATTTYKQLYGFLGETDTAVEAANLLAQITTEEQNLAQWTNILKGVYATFPDSLPVEALAEATNETINTGKVTGNLADALNWLGVSEDAVNQKLATMTSLQEREAFLRDTLNGLYGNAAAIYDHNNSAIVNMNNAQADLDLALAEATKYITPLLTSLTQLAAGLLQSVKPALETVAAAIIVFVQWLAAAAKAISNFFGGMTGKSTKTANDIANSTKQIKTTVGGAASGANGLNKALGGAAKAAKELKKQSLGFDELNVISSPTEAAGGGSSGGASVGAIEVPAVEIPDMSDLNLGEAFDFSDKVEEVENALKGIVTLAGIAGAAFAAWKITKGIKDLKEAGKLAETFKSKSKQIGGVAMIIAGAIALVKGYSDAWINGLDWKNFALVLGGISLIVGGIALAFGPLAASIALIAGGIAAVVLGIKDFVTNGYSMQAVILIAVGAIAVLIGSIWAFNAALLANPITWVVVAIMALVAVFVILWNECEGFRNFWLNLWDAIVAAFKAVVEWFKQAGKDIAQFFVDAWNWIKEAWANVGEFFADCWQSIKDAFAAVGTWFSDLFTGAWNGIKNAWSSVKKWFSECWQGIKNVFAAVGTWFSNIFTNAWNGIKNAFAAVGSFFTGIWNTIKEIFSKVGSTIGDAVSGAFKGAINWVLEKAIGIINGFINSINWCIGIINDIPGVSISRIKTLSVPALATGGIVQSETLARIGEGGKKEAVLPLEQNTEWMDILADRIASRSSAPTKIVLTLDGTELGWANIHSINSITKQTGALQLNVI